MKIDGTGLVKGPNVEAPQPQKPFELKTGDNVVQQTLKGAHKETVTLSKRAELADRLLEAAKAAPDIRHDLIAKIKGEIESGTYHRPAESIAKNIIQEAIEFLKHS